MKTIIRRAAPLRSRDQVTEKASMYKGLFTLVFLLATALLPNAAPAQSAGQAMQHGDMKAAAAMADGEIRKVDKDAGKLTIKHGPIASMDMPPMTMVYRVKDRAMLDQVKPGDKVRFVADKIGGAFTVMQIEPAQ